MSETTGLTIREYLDALRRRWWLVVGVAILALGATAAPLLVEEPTYASVATVRNSYATNAPPADELVPENAAIFELVSDAEMVESRALRDQVAERLGEVANQVGTVTGTLIPFSTVIDIRVTASSPEAAHAAADAYAATFVERRRASTVGPIEATVETLRQRAVDAEAEAERVEAELAESNGSPQATEALEFRHDRAAYEVRASRERADDLELEAGLRGESIAILSPASDAVALPVVRRRSLAAAAVLGLLLGAAVAALTARRAVNPRSRR